MTNSETKLMTFCFIFDLSLVEIKLVKICILVWAIYAMILHTVKSLWVHTDRSCALLERFMLSEILLLECLLDRVEFLDSRDFCFLLMGLRVGDGELDVYCWGLTCSDSIWMVNMRTRS